VSSLWRRILGGRADPLGPGAARAVIGRGGRTRGCSRWLRVKGST